MTRPKIVLSASPVFLFINLSIWIIFIAMGETI